MTGSRRRWLGLHGRPLLLGGRLLFPELSLLADNDKDDGKKGGHRYQGHVVDDGKGTDLVIDEQPFFLHLQDHHVLFAPDPVVVEHPDRDVVIPL